MRTSEVLNKAADLIEQRGWVQGEWGVGYGTDYEGAPLCAEGAIAAAAGLDSYAAGALSVTLPACPAYRAVLDYVRPRVIEERPGLAGSEIRLYSFNDTDGRTAAEVIEVLRAAAVIEQAKEQQDAPVAVSA